MFSIECIDLFDKLIKGKPYVKRWSEKIIYINVVVKNHLKCDFMQLYYTIQLTESSVSSTVSLY